MSETPKPCWYGCPPAHGCYVASNGEVWHPAPVWVGWQALADGHDEDSPALHAATREAAIEAIEELVAEEREEAEA